MNKNNTNIWFRDGKQNHLKYRESETGSYKASSNRFFRNNRRKPYFSQQYSTTTLNHFPQIVNSLSTVSNITEPYRIYKEAEQSIQDGRRDDSVDKRVDVNNIQNGTKWKLHKIENGDQLEVKPNLTQIYTSRSEEKMDKILPDFNKKPLLTVSRSTVDKLYSGKQCFTCGERILSNVKEHMDGHFRENSFAKDRKYRKCRNWYQEEDCVDESPFEVQLKNHQKEKEKKKPIKRPRRRFSKNVCLVCNETFSEFFNEEDGEWQLSDAISLDGKIYHEICAEDRYNI